MSILSYNKENKKNNHLPEVASAVSNTAHAAGVVNLSASHNFNKVNIMPNTPGSSGNIYRGAERNFINNGIAPPTKVTNYPKFSLFRSAAAVVVE